MLKECKYLKSLELNLIYTPIMDEQYQKDLGDFVAKFKEFKNLETLDLNL